MALDASTSWYTVGSAGFALGYTAYISLAFQPNSSQAFVAYQDVGDANQAYATVKRFDGSSWVPVGPTGFSAAPVTYTSLAFQPNNSVPYLAFSDFSASHKATVMAFGGSGWAVVGSAGISAGQADYNSLAFQPNSSVPYLAFSDYGLSASQAAAVMRFDGASWSPVGGGNISAGQADYVRLAFSPDTSVPYVAFSDYGATSNSQGATVMRFDGTAFVAVGSPGFSAGVAYYTSLAFEPITFRPYLAYADQSIGSGMAVVQSFDSSSNSWSPVGSPGFSSSTVDYTSLAFDPTTAKPYIAYTDHYFGPSNATVEMFPGN